MGIPNSIFTTLKWTAIGFGSALISKFDKNKGKEFLVNSLLDMPGVPAKFSQFLDMRWQDKDPERKVRQLSKSTELILRIEDVKSIINQQAYNLFEQISEISANGISASLGQVHWAKLNNSAEVVIKLQYPGLDIELPNQLETVMLLMEKSPAKNFGLNISTYRKAFVELIGRELDYSLESKIQMKFYNNYCDSERSKIAIAKVFEQWGSQKILVQEFLPSKTFKECLNLSSVIREEIARTIVEFWLASVFEKRLLHTDLQPKNWGYNEELQKVVIYDFGSWIEITQDQSLLLEAMIEGVLERNSSSPFDILVALGFDGEKLLPLLNRLPILLETLLDPFLTSGWWNAEQWDLGAKLDSILGAEAWWFRTAGPPWFLWLMRSAQGLVHALETLEVGVPFQSIFFDVINRLPRDRFVNFKIDLQNELLEKYKRNPIFFNHEAKHFCVKVTEEDRDVVSLQFPIHVVQDLENLMGEDVRAKIESMGYNLVDIKTKMIREGLLKGPVLDFHHGKRHYLLWAE